MNGNDLRKLAVYLYNVEMKKFAEDVYNTDYIDSYIENKYDRAMNNTVRWLGELDEIRLEALANAIN